MDKRIVFLGGLGLGAGLMYLFDPQAGSRRRKRAATKTGGAWQRGGQGLGAFSRQVGTRARGMAEGVRVRLRPAVADDMTLAERVRERLGQAGVASLSVDVSVLDGCALLAGRVREGDVDAVLRAAGSVPGVRSVENHLEVHAGPEDEPAPDGSPARAS
jgi:osmotically-inducible protein OsmY